MGITRNRTHNRIGQFQYAQQDVEQVEQSNEIEYICKGEHVKTVGCYKYVEEAVCVTGRVCRV